MHPSQSKPVLQPASFLVLATYLLREQAGAAQATINIINAMSHRYHGGVSVITFDYDPELLSPDVRVVKLNPPTPIRFFWRFPSYFSLHQCYQRLKSVAVPPASLCYTQSTVMALAYRRLNPSVPIVSHTGAVISSREYREEALRQGFKGIIEGKIEEYVIDYLEQRSYRESKWRHIVSTSLVAREREKYFQLPADFFMVHPLGIDLARFNRCAPFEDMRTLYGIPDDAFVIVTVARLIPWKNVDMVLHAISRSQERPWLFVVGAGSETQFLQKLAFDLKIYDWVRFIGHADPVPFLACSDVFALPSRIESFGMVYAEAMSMGLPCLGLRYRPPEVLSSAMDVIPEGKAGFCVDDVDQLVERIDWLAANRDAAREMGQFAHRYAVTHYSVERYIDSLDALRREMSECCAPNFSP